MREVVCPHCQSHVIIGSKRSKSYACQKCQGEFTLEFEEDEFESLERELAAFSEASSRQQQLLQRKKPVPFVKTQDDVCFFNEKSDTFSDLTLLTLYGAPALFVVGFLFGKANGGFSEGISTGIGCGLFIVFFLSLPRLFSLGEIIEYEYWYVNRKSKKLTFTKTNEHGTVMVFDQRSFSDQLAVSVRLGSILFFDKNWNATKQIYGTLISKRRFSNRLGIQNNRPKDFNFDMNDWGMVLASSDPFATRDYATSCNGRINASEFVLLRAENQDSHVFVTILTDALLLFVPLVFRLMTRKVLTVNRVNKPLLWSKRERTYLDQRRKTLLVMTEFTRGWVPSRLINITKTSIHVSHRSTNYNDSYTVYNLYLNRRDYLSFSSDEEAKSMMHAIRGYLPSLPVK